MTEPSVGPLTRGFLFADLRGYTAFAEAHGDRAAADLLDRYRALVRTVVAASAGAEIRTEGDSFYVVFPSASAAVGAGLAIVAAATESSAAEPAAPIRVGVGVHAGEAEERAEGYVGTAVNVAARVCAEATAGEVLVTDTVRSLVRTGARYRFTARGSHRLKGLAEPVALYRAEVAVDGAVAIAADGGSDRRRRTIGVAAVVSALVLGLAVIVLVAQPFGAGAGSSSDPSTGGGHSPDPSGGLAGAGSSVGPSPSPSMAPFPNGIIKPGTYQTTDFEPAIRLTFADDAWWKEVELPSALELALVPLSEDLSPCGLGDDLRVCFGYSGLVFFRPGIGYVGCSHDQTTTIGAKTKEDVVDYLAKNPGLDSEAPSATSIGGLDGMLVRFRLGPPCGTVPRLKPLFQLWAGTPGKLVPIANQRVLVALSGWEHEVFVTEVDGDVLGIWFAAPKDRWDALAESARSLVTTLEVVD